MNKVEKKLWDELIEKYGNLYLADTESDDIELNDFENWYNTYSHEDWLK